MPYITLSHGPTYYELDGPDTAELIIFIHGFSSPSQVWDPSFEFLKTQGYQVLRYDLYGRGRSAKPGKKYTEKFLVAQLSELIHSLQLTTKPSTVIGMSMGGVIAACFIKQYPTQVNRLVLIDTAGFPWSPQLVPKMLRIPLVNKKIFSVRAKKALLSKHQVYLEKLGKIVPYADIYARQFQEKAYLNALLSTLLHFPTQSAEEVFQHIGQMDIPKLLIWGEEDETIPFFMSDRFTKVLPGVEFHSIPGAGHMPHFEQPDVVNPIILAFLCSH
ncbi:MAG: alpha/beta fold hydrolase [Promethearchaeota archaeon]